MMSRREGEDVTMSLTMRCPDANAMELGGVDTGSMKAYEQPTVAGIMKYRGFTETRMACRDSHALKISFGKDLKVSNTQTC